MDDLVEYYSQFSEQSVSAIHHVLRSRRRRLVILITASSFLDEGSPSNLGIDDGTQVTVRELGKKITAIEQDVALQQATGEPYHNVYTSLIQTHLPRLDNVEAINYDQHRKVVTPDQNLLALSAVAITSSPLSTLLFHPNSADDFAGGSTSSLGNSPE